MSIIVPAVIPKSLEEVFAIVKKITPFSRELQIDVVDGIFVENISWPYGVGDMLGTPNDIGSIASMFDIEVDLMITDPITEIPRWITAGAKRLVIHIESCFDIEEAKKLCDNAGISLGIAASSDTPLSLFLSALEYGDYAQCMGIRQIGVQGEPFDTKVLARIKAVRETFPSMLISVDGSVNMNTISELYSAGASRFIAGSAILGSTDPESAYAQLLSLVHK